MRKYLLAAVAISALAVPVQAQVLDPLHLSCSTCGIDNQTFTPTNTGTPTSIEVDSSPPGASGTLLLKILIPNNELGSISSVGVTGASSGPALLQAGTFIAGETLEGFLNIGMGSGASANPFGAFQPSSFALDPGITGFDVFLFNAGNFTLTGAFNTTPAVFNIPSSLPVGTWILGDIVQTGAPCLNTGEVFCNDVTTAPSSALFVNQTSVTPVPAPIVGAGIPGLLAGCLGMFGLNRFRRRRNNPAI